MNNLATVYRAAGRLSDAVPLQEAALKGLKARLGADHTETLSTMNSLLTAYLDGRRWSEAEAVGRECLALRERKAPDEWWRFHTMSQLGAALAGQKRYLEAEPMLVGGHAGLRARAARLPTARKTLLAESAGRVVALYDAWGRTEEAVEWRRTLARERADADFPADPFAR